MNIDVELPLLKWLHEQTGRTRAQSKAARDRYLVERAEVSEEDVAREVAAHKKATELGAQLPPGYTIVRERPYRRALWVLGQLRLSHIDNVPLEGYDY